MSKKYVANKFEIIGGTSSDVLLADGTLGSAPSGLEAIDEGNGIGWRLIGRDPANHLPIGLESLDLAYTISNDGTEGISGDYGLNVGAGNEISTDYSYAIGTINEIKNPSASSIAVGSFVTGTANVISSMNYFNTVGGVVNQMSDDANIGANGIAYYSGINGAYNIMPQGRASFMFGMGLRGASPYTTIVGAANVDLTITNSTLSATDGSTLESDNPAFIVGIGNVTTAANPTLPTYTRANGFVAMRSGNVSFPSLTKAKIDAAGTDSAVTKEWVESKVSSVSVTEKHAFTAAQIKALNSAPIDLIPAAGAGTYIRLVMIDWKFNWGTTAFDGTRAQVKWGDDSLVLSAPFFFFETEDRFEGDASSSLLVRQENSKIYLTADADSVLTGDSTLDLYITYQIVTL